MCVATVTSYGVAEVFLCTQTCSKLCSKSLMSHWKNIFGSMEFLQKAEFLKFIEKNLHGLTSVEIFLIKRHPHLLEFEGS